MATTTNFGWETPDDTDLVKDGALAMRTLGNSIDSSFVDLKGGTTGQILSKASNTDLDYTWINNDQGDITGVTAGTGLTGGGTTGAVTLTNDMATTITAAGDIVIGTGSGTYDNLPIGTTGQVLTADTTVSPYKVKWAAAGGSFSGVSLNDTNTTQNISNATTTALTWNNEIFDTDGFHSTSSNTSRITIPSGKGGKYEIKFTGQFGGNATGMRIYYVYKNGSAIIANIFQGTTNDTSMTICYCLNLAVGDYLELYVEQNSGSTLSFYKGSTFMYANFSAIYLGA